MAVRNPLKRIGRKTRIALLVLLVLIVAPPLLFGIACPLMMDVPKSPTREGQAAAPVPLPQIEGYPRPEESTYLTYPEWYIVYSSEEYANFLQKGRPSQFPYFSSIGQYWCGYCTVYQITNKQYGFNAGDHLMLWVIGVSFSVENLIKGVYENTIGRLTEWVSSAEKTDEDQYAFRANQEYVAFIYDSPWFEFSFGKKLGGLWSETALGGPNLIRKWERKLILSVEFGVKAIYGGLIKLASRAVYGKEPTEIYASVENVPEGLLQKEPRVKQITGLGPQAHVVAIPRYRLFTEIVPALTRQGLHFRDIAGNHEIFVTAIAPRDWTFSSQDGEVLFVMTILTKPELKRLGIKARVKSLHAFLATLEQAGVKIEHLYDY